MKDTQDRGIPALPDGTRTVELLEKDGWTGPDNSLAESLFHYNIAWRDDGDDYKFIVRRHDDAFDWGNFRKDLDAIREWGGWADLQKVAHHAGCTTALWLTLPLPRKVQDMILYCGLDNVIGEERHTFEIRRPDDYQEDE